MAPKIKLLKAQYKYGAKPKPDARMPGTRAAAAAVVAAASARLIGQARGSITRAPSFSRGASAAARRVQLGQLRCVAVARSDLMAAASKAPWLPSHHRFTETAIAKAKAAATSTAAKAPWIQANTTSTSGIEAASSSSTLPPVPPWQGQNWPGKQ